MSSRSQTCRWMTLLSESGDEVQQMTGELHRGRPKDNGGKKKT